MNDVAMLLDGLGLGSAVVLGLSFGGMIAQNLALARPDLVSALIVAGCPPRIPEEGRPGILDRGRTAEESGMDAVIGATIERWFTPAFRDNNAVAQVAARLAANDPSNWAAAWEAVSEHDAFDRLKMITVPALVVAGEMDSATPLSAKKSMADALPNGQLKVLERAPHMMQIETADAFTETVARFVRSLDAA